MAPTQPPSPPISLLFTRADILVPYLSRNPTASPADLDLALSNMTRFGYFKETESGSGIYEIFAPKNLSSLFWRVKNLEEEIKTDGRYRGKMMEGGNLRRGTERGRGRGFEELEEFWDFARLSYSCTCIWFGVGLGDNHRIT